MTLSVDFVGDSSGTATNTVRSHPPNLPSFQGVPDGSAPVGAPHPGSVPGQPATGAFSVRGLCRGARCLGAPACRFRFSLNQSTGIIRPGAAFVKSYFTSGCGRMRAPYYFGGSGGPAAWGARSLAAQPAHVLHRQTGHVSLLHPGACICPRHAPHLSQRPSAGTRWRIRRSAKPPTHSPAITLRGCRNRGRTCLRQAAGLTPEAACPWCHKAYAAGG